MTQPRATILFDAVQAYYYVVQKGDTLSAIGERLRVHWTKLASTNKLRNPNLIHPGQLIRVPDHFMGQAI